MKISFLFLFCIQFLSFESNPLTRNEALSNHFSEDKTDDIGYEMYHKLDEAAQKALDLAEEAKSFAEEAGKLQDKEDTELTEQKNSIERNAFLLQNYRTAFRKHFNPEEPSPSRVKRMVEEKAKSKSKKEDKKPKKKKAKGRQIDGDDEADEEGEADDNGDENTEGSGDDDDDDEVEPKEPEKSEDDTDGAGKGDGNGEYSQDKVENAKKHLLESDDLLQQLQEKFSNILKEFGEDPGIVIAHTDNSTTSSHEEDTDGDGKDGDDAHDDETDDEDDKEKEDHEEKEDTDTETDDEEETGDEGEEGYRKGKSKGKGKQGKKGSKKN